MRCRCRSIGWSIAASSANGFDRSAAARIDFSPSAATFAATQIPRRTLKETTMAKAASIKIKLVSSADTGFYYVTKKNSRTMTDKLVKKKYDPVAKKHVEFRESKIK